MNYDGIVYYTKGPEKYNKDWWYSFQIDCAVYSHKYPPLPPITRRIGNLGKRGTSFVRRKEMQNYSKSMEQK